MPRPKPNKLHDDLDALLDGRPVELTEELAPLVETAGALRSELAAFELDPAVADRHLERVLDGSATVVPIPLRPQPNGWELRRRVAAVVLAAALVLAPATIASAAALPGQAMYPLKLAIEQVRLASVQWSPTREAVERTRVADTRLDELERLVELKLFNQVVPALSAFTRAVVAAHDAVEEAKQEGAAGAELAALAGRLGTVQGKAARTFVLVRATLKAAQLPTISGSTREAIEAAVQDSQEILASPEVKVTPPAPPPGTAPSPPPGPPPSASAPETSQPTASTTPEPPPATEPTTPTTLAPTTTVEPASTTPPSTEDTAAPPASGGGEPADGRAKDAVPPTTAAGP